MKLRPLTVGPIIGATTGASARVWGRGRLELTSNGPRRCFGAARLRPHGSFSYGEPTFFKMNPNFDMTGVVRFEELGPEREYDYQIGWFFSELDLTDLQPDFPLDWSDINKATFETGAADETSARAFIFGSCRYLLRLFGRSWFDNRGDKTFRSILNQIDAGVRTNHMLMIGDQIYADDLNIIAADETLDAYFERYREAFSQPYIAELMSRVPTYMTLDDHEIEDGWPAHASLRDYVVKYPAAIHALVAYQLSYSPLLSMVAPNKMVGVPRKLWYTFQDGCCDFFVTDTRTERYFGQDEYDRRIISDQQMDALKSWLADGSGRVKFVVTSVPFFPDPMNLDDRSDKWSGFLWQRTQILDLIREENVKRVVFLGGDLHLSVTSELVSPGAPEFKVLSIISSPFFWPYPSAGWHRFQLSGNLASTSMHTYELANSSRVRTTDLFTRISTGLERLGMQVFSRKGELLYTSEYEYQTPPDQ
jgi:alkaline phosphatase D